MLIFLSSGFALLWQLLNCIESKNPTSTFVVFEENDNQEENIDIELKYQNQDALEEYTSGYVSTNHGDSGGPFWTQDIANNGQERSVIIAILSGGIEDGVDVSTKKDDFCRAGATKITNEILKWIKEISGLI